MATAPTAPTMATHYPVSLVVTDQACLVVGGGAVAAHKAAGLARAGAHVTVVAPSIDPAIERLAAEHHVVVERREYRSGEAARYRLVVTATGVGGVDAAVAADADEGGVWVNSADDPAHCSFFLPAVHRDGRVSVAVSTGGASPALASWLRDRAAEACGQGLDDLAALLDAARRRLRAAGRSTSDVAWRSLLDGRLPDLVRRGRVEDAAALVDELTG